MTFFELLGLLVFIYYVINVTLWIILDSDVELAFKERFGQSVSILRGKVVWITGASSGIGKSLSLSLAKYGIKLVLSARRLDELELVKTECLALSNGLLANDDILILPMDMLSIDQHQQHFDTVIQHFGKLDILVNNAGRSQRAQWEDIDLQVDKDLFELNVFSVINLTRIVVRYFKETNGGYGHVAATSSGAGLTTVPYSASYSASKQALQGYLLGLKAENPNIDVTILCPGPVATNFLQECFTNKVDEKYGKSVSENDRRMTSERCGNLFAIALANKTFLSWVGLFPCSMLLYISQYYPNVRMIVLKILGTKGLKKIREGH